MTTQTGHQVMMQSQPVMLQTGHQVQIQAGQILTLQQPLTLQGQQPIVIISTHTQDGIQRKFASKSAIVLGSIQVCIGILAGTLQIVGYVIQPYLFQVSIGLTSGIFFVITGGLGIAAGKSKKKCPIIAAMVLSIIAALICLPFLTMGAIGTAAPDWPRCNETNYDVEYRNDCHDWHQEETIYCFLDEDPKPGCFIINPAFILFAIIEAVCALWLASLSCCSVCCNRQVHSGQILYSNNGQLPGLTIQQAVAPPQYQLQSTYPQTSIYPHPGNSMIMSNQYPADVSLPPSYTEIHPTNQGTAAETKGLI